LRDYGIKATFYIVTSRIGKLGSFGWEEIKDLHREGNEIGSHTHTHPRLTRISGDRVNLEFKKSQEILKRFGCRTLAYPYGECNSNTVELAKKYFSAARGYYNTVTENGDFGYNVGLDSELYNLKVFSSETSPLLELPFSEFKANFNRAMEIGINKKAWVIFVFHGLGKTALKNVVYALSKGKPNLAVNFTKDLIVTRDKLSKLRWMCEHLRDCDQLDTVTVSEGSSKIFGNEPKQII